MYISTTVLLYRVILSLEAPNKFGKIILAFGETHSSALGCERRPVSALIMSRSCFASFPVCVYKFSSHYLNNVIFYGQYFGTSSDRITLYINFHSTLPHVSTVHINLHQVGYSCTKIHPAQSNNSKTLYANRFKPSTSTLWENIPEFGETHSSVLGCERRPVSASIMSRSCFASFPVFVYKLSILRCVTPVVLVQ